MVDEAAAHPRHGLEAAMRVRGEAGHLGTVVQAPAVLAAEVGADLAAGQARRGAVTAVAARVAVVVVNAEQEGVELRPGHAERGGADDRGRWTLGLEQGGTGWRRIQGRPIDAKCTIVS
jgi:hypothetical protein